MAGTPAFEPAPTHSSPLSVTGDVQPDLISALSSAPRAAERLLDLRQRSADLNSLIPKHAEMSEVTTAKIQAEDRLSRVTSHPSQSGFGLKPLDPRTVAAEKAVEEATAAVVRLQKREAETSARWHAASRLLQQVEAWLRDGRPGGTVLEDVAGLPATLPKNGGLVDAIARDQQHIDRLKAELDGIRRSGFPASDCKRAMREHITALAERGKPDVTPLVKRDDDVAFVHERAQISIYNADRPLIGFGSLPDTLGLIAWLCRDEMIATDKMIDEACAGDKGLSRPDRERAEAAVMSELLVVERHQADLIWRAQAEGLPISHRPDCDPKAILGVVAVVRAPAQPSQLSAAHAYDIVGSGR